MGDEIPDVQAATQRDPINFIALHGLRQNGGKKSKTSPNYVGVTPLHELLIYVRTQPIDALAPEPIPLGTGETVVFTADGRYTDVRIFVTNCTANTPPSQVKVTLYLRPNGKAAATKYKLCTLRPCSPGSDFEYTGIGLAYKDVISGLCDSASGVNVFVFGRKVMVP